MPLLWEDDVEVGVGGCVAGRGAATEAQWTAASYASMPWKRRSLPVVGSCNSRKTI